MPYVLPRVLQNAELDASSCCAHSRINTKNRTSIDQNAIISTQDTKIQDKFCNRDALQKGISGRALEIILPQSDLEARLRKTVIKSRNVTLFKTFVMCRE